MAMPPTSQTKPTPPQGPYKPTLILHGGAGNLSRENLPPALYEKYHASLLAYLKSTKDLLETGGTAVDGACHAVSLMEDDPLFNCGRGSVFTSAGEIEMEASLAVACVDDAVEFEGMVKRSAAVSMVKRTRHPILLARAVLGMGDEDHGFGGTGEMHGHLSGEDVERWGWRKGLDKKPRSWFWTERRWLEHRRGLGKKDTGHTYVTGSDSEDDDADSHEHESQSDTLADIDPTLELPSQGTVGAVCMDSWGAVAVATSTGGLTNKRPGRIGDTPTVGAGFWAESWTAEQADDNETAPASDTSPARSVSERIAASLRSEVGFWMGDCMGSAQSHQHNPTRSSSTQTQTIVEKEPLVPDQMSYTARHAARRRAVAMSGTGNGDSFLRTNACRTAAAIPRFAGDEISLAHAVTTVAGPDGELQRSAGDRWGKTGQGEGGIIGIETVHDGNKKEGKTVFDFNCGGLWRAYFELDQDGNEKARVMVFREEY